MLFITSLFLVTFLFVSSLYELSFKDEIVFVTLLIIFMIVAYRIDNDDIISTARDIIKAFILALPISLVIMLVYAIK